MRKIACGLALASLLASPTALADPTKRECIDANADAQVKQKEGKLHAARAALRLCMNPSCPGAVRDDCTQLLAALSALIPSVVFEAKDAKGDDLSAVKVAVDGQPLAEKLDGNPLEVDPGEHTFTFEAPGAPLVTKKLVLRQGERTRREPITLDVGEKKTTPPPVETPPPPPAAPATAPPATPPEPPREPEPRGSGSKTLGIVVVATGVVGLGVGAVLGAMASGKWSDAQAACTNASCPDRGAAEDTRQSALSLAAGSTIAFIAGGVLVAGGAVLWFTAPSSASGIRVAPTLNGALLTGHF